MEPKTDGILKNQSDHLRVYARLYVEEVAPARWEVQCGTSAEKETMVSK